MPDLDPLPPSPRRPALPPRAGDLDDLRRRTARRRAGRYGAAGSAVAVAVVAALLFNGATSGLDTIVADPGEPYASGSPSPTVTPASPGATASPEPSPVGTPTSAPAAPASTSPTNEPSPSATAAPSPTATPAPPDEPHASVEREDVAYTAGGCNSGISHGPGWCVRMPGGRTVQAGEPHGYYMWACRLPGSGDGTITFYSRDELSFAMLDQQGRERFSFGQASNAPTHTITVRGGLCARWGLTYDATDSTGAPLAPGDYSATLSVYGHYSGSNSVSAYGFGVRVTE